MTHPSHEEWMSFLYGELETSKRGQLDSHLCDCPECKASVASWRDAMTQLDAFNVPGRNSRQNQTMFRPGFVKWGMAALFILGIGFGFGRIFKASSQEVKKLEAAMLPRIREQLREDFRAALQAGLASTQNGATNEFRQAVHTAFTEWTANQNATANSETHRLIAALTESIIAARAEDREATLALLKKLEQQNLAAFALLKKNLETVAVVADNRFHQTETQLGQLISYAQPDPE